MTTFARSKFAPDAWRAVLLAVKPCVLLVIVIGLGNAAILRAGTRGSIQGRVIDPQRRSIAGAHVMLTNLEDGSLRTTQTSSRGLFQFSFVPLGTYRLEARVPGFEAMAREVVVSAGEVLTTDVHMTLARGAAQSVEIRAQPVELDTRSAAVQSGFNYSELMVLPRASETLQAVLVTTNTAWYSQEHLHIRGAHQVDYQVNGVEVPDLSLFGSVTPFIDPRNMRYTEVTTGGLQAEYGNRTAGLVNVVSRSGFDSSSPRGLLEVAGGSLDRGSLFGSLGKKVTDKFAFYAQASGLVSGRAFNPPPDFLTPFDLNHNGRIDILDPPASQTVHNFRRSLQSFTSLDYLPSARDSVNVTMGGYRTDLQIPNTVEQELARRDYTQLERDQFQNLHWTRVLSLQELMSFSVFYHFNRVEIRGRSDEPQIPLAEDNRGANYYGASGEFARHAGRHFIKAGTQVFEARLLDSFAVLPIPLDAAGARTPFLSKVPSTAAQESLYIQDQFNWTDRWTLDLGGRGDFFAAHYHRRQSAPLSQHDAFLSPRVGLAYRIGGSQTVLFANFAYLHLAPPIEFFELPSNAGTPGSAFPAGVRFTPTLAERDLQFELGARFAAHGFRFRVNPWFKRQNHFLDHAQLSQLNGTGQLINPNIFLPVNLEHARTQGVEAQVETPAYRGVKAFANYSLNYAQAIGGRVGGFQDGKPPATRYFFLDHDQRHSVNSGTTYRWERVGAFATLLYSFGSGFPDSSDELLAPYFGGVPACATPHCRLPAHSTFSFSTGKTFRKGLAARLEMENVKNRIYPINLGSEFNGSHVSAPRLVTLRLDYNF